MRKFLEMSEDDWVRLILHFSDVSEAFARQVARDPKRLALYRAVFHEHRQYVTLH